MEGEVYSSEKKHLKEIRNAVRDASRHSRFIGLVLGLGLGFFIGGRLSDYIHTSANKEYHRFPITQQVQEGFIVPSQLEIKLKALDSGKKATIMNYDGVDYDLRLNKNGKPYLQGVSELK